ncbi:transporter substrate-binding domain-containing protein [Candidatus Formimonas warabiya]|uniref:Solute-binding protein family 3/N-terminal domain-containing protein n=1 Tax=Formimonas warabiya TaxID=1761012 RepID=A0A3G1L030_FORW1|nr:transporter substrate-binding domain-containing protein [Candidatus Formimonas warabiya]ATW28017.1 hypothetical protein DCMF_27605 [Candidatus Formimonas warabiya]
MKRFKCLGVLIFFLVILMGAFSGCSQNTASDADSKEKSDTEGAESGTAPKTIYVGTQPDYPPFDYADESGALTGYDIELVREIFKRLPEYKLEFLPTAWDGITLGLDSNRTQMIADQMTVNEEREKKYYLSEPYFSNEVYLVVKKGRTDIKSLEDLKGKTLELVVGTTPATAIEEWNEANGNQIKIQYTKATNYTDPLNDVANGRVDAYVEFKINADAVIKEQGLQIETVGEPVFELPVAFVYRRDELGKELKEKIDAVMQELKADGTMGDLSVKWTGGDYIPD